MCVTPSRLSDGILLPCRCGASTSQRKGRETALRGTARDPISFSSEAECSGADTTACEFQQNCLASRKCTPSTTQSQWQMPWYPNQIPFVREAVPIGWAGRASPTRCPHRAVWPFGSCHEVIPTVSAERRPEVSMKLLGLCASRVVESKQESQ